MVDAVPDTYMGCPQTFVKGSFLIFVTSSAQAWELPAKLKNGGRKVMESDKKQEQVAVFRYGLIAPALHMTGKERRKYFKDLEGRDLEVPYFGVKRYKKCTFRGWLQDYKAGGLDSLRPALRCDKGISKKISDNIHLSVKTAIERFPFLSCSGIYRLLINEGYIRPGDFGETTLRKYINEHGMRDACKEIIGRKKYEKENINELWVCDFMHGPHIRNGKKKSRVYLCSIIDDHSRVIAGWGWYFFENCNALAKTLKKAISIYGLPKVFYCDNGSVFVSNYLHLVCANMGVALVHSKPYDSPSRGKIERFFKTVREKFLAGLDVTNITLDELNNSFEQWLDKDYHRTVHSGINECPFDRYFNNAAKNKVKMLFDHELDTYFLNTIKRKVKNDATVSIDKKYYEVPPAYIGKYVYLSFPIDNPKNITLMDKGKPVVQIKPVDVHLNANKPYTAIHFKDIQGDGNDHGGNRNV